MLMWQERHLNPPPVFTFQHDLEADITGILKDARKVFEEAVKVTEVYKALGSEMYIIKKIGYKSKSSLRNEKSLQGIRQLERSLKRLKEVNPVIFMKPLLDSWPSLLNLHHGAVVYLPSKPMLEYALVRLLGCASLLHQIINRAVVTYTNAIDQIKIGMQAKNMLVFAAAASRIWYLCRAVKLHQCGWYERLLPLLDILKPTKAIWLKDGFTLPTDLGEWLGKELGMPASTTAKRLTGNAKESVSTTSDMQGTMSDMPNVMDSKAEAPSNNLILEDIGEVVARTDKSTNQRKQNHQAVLSIDRSMENLSQSTLPQGITHGREVFNTDFWFSEIDKCRLIKELPKVIRSFRKKYQIKSKGIKNCCKNLWSSSQVNDSLVSCKKQAKNAIIKAANFQVKKMVTKEKSQKKQRNIEDPNNNTNGHFSAKDDLASELSKGNDSLSNRRTCSMPFFKKLKLEMLRPNGLNEVQRELDCGVLSNGIDKRIIPKQHIPKLKKLLKNCFVRLQNVSKQERDQVISRTVKQIRKYLLKIEKEEIQDATKEQMETKEKILKNAIKTKKKKRDGKKKEPKEISTIVSEEHVETTEKVIKKPMKAKKRKGGIKKEPKKKIAKQEHLSGEVGVQFPNVKGKTQDVPKEHMDIPEKVLKKPIKAKKRKKDDMKNTHKKKSHKLEPESMEVSVQFPNAKKKKQGDIALSSLKGRIGKPSTQRKDTKRRDLKNNQRMKGKQKKSKGRQKL